ncbi:hypothetical protein GJ744_008135 [Endocarpon pusillum]|uniref:Uncharacterized protein n=1 Tax=Endocarpon pusillum TaxID=364733 RepID=A0A8H7A3V1_9EURO|nr:hypothetical protein GJ744_008135 [Endocarpon pusillum]
MADAPPKAVLVINPSSEAVDRREEISERPPPNIRDFDATVGVAPGMTVVLWNWVDGTTSLRALLTSGRLLAPEMGTERGEITELSEFANSESDVAPAIPTELLVIVAIDTSVLISIPMDKPSSIMAVDLLNC